MWYLIRQRTKVKKVNQPDQEFSTRGDFAPGGHWAVSGDIPGFQDSVGPTGLWRAEVRDAAQTSYMHRTVPLPK